MSGFFKFINIFETNLISGSSKKIICDPVIIEFISNESRSYKIPCQYTRVVPRNEEACIAKDAALELETEKKYIVLTARTKEENPYVARHFCENEIDKILGILTCIYNPDIFRNSIYRGWQLEKDKGAIEAWIQISEKVDMDEKIISTEIANTKKLQLSDSDVETRFELMARFFVKSLQFVPCEESFLLLWTALEIFPMKDTTNIRPISEYLGSYLKLSSSFVKEKLDIGKLYSQRCDLVHNGKLTIDTKEMGRTFSKLERIVHEVMRCMCGLPYQGTLDEFLK